ncbi:MAG: hypothetical protein ACD_23C00552G0003 [uncultured bacterium]|nr:MAG: hypothetical protein ACD_23C00552G0003 [uncultured bacterium]
MPASLTRGISTGTRISTVGVRSITMPTTMMKTMMASISSVGESTSGCIRSTTISGTSAMVIRKADTAEAATSSITIAVVSDAANSTSNRSLTFISRYTNSATKSEYMAATAPASVGVKTPLRKPPTMITGNSKAHEPSFTDCQISCLEALSAITMLALLDRHHHTRASVTPIMMPGAIPARNSFEMETPLATPKMMKGIEGGMIGAMMPPVAIRPAESPGI